MLASIDRIADTPALPRLTGRGAQVMLRALTGVTLGIVEARSLWPRILEHKWFLSERLGRDVGLRVAAIDYLENIEREILDRAA